MNLDSCIKRRLKIIIYLFLALVIALVLRLYFLQVITGQLYAEQAQENMLRLKTIPAPRGNIYDRNGKLLVKSVPVVSVAVEPHIVLENEDVIKILSEKLHMSYDSIVKKLEDSNLPYLERLILKQDIDYEAMVYLKENASFLPGVEVIDIFLREYNYDFLASHILGYTGEIDKEKLKTDKYKNDYEGGDQIGLTGIELFYEEVLRGRKGKIIYEVDPLGKPVAIIEEESYVTGNSLYLTIDIDLQKEVEEILSQSIAEVRERKVPRSDEYYKVPGGAVVVLGVENCEVLAMASYPTFDPEIFTGGVSVDDWEYLNDPENEYPLNNRAMMAYHPGSAIKIVTAYAGLSEDIIDENTTFVCRGIWYGLGEDFPKWCWNKGGHGSENILRGIRDSCDIFFYEVGYRLFLKNNNIEELLQKCLLLFGFGSETGIDLPYEDRGLVPDRQWKEEYFKDKVEYSIWFPGDTVNMAIGQGYLLATPLQMAQAYAIIANGGIEYTPHLAREIRDCNGDIFIDLDRSEYEDLDMDNSYINIIETGLELVVKEGTAASRFRDFPLNEIQVAGKTGTSEVAGKQDYAWFASYAPIGDPQYVVVVMLEEAGGGSKSAAPIAEKIYKYLFNLNY
jgi:penicillin-binding protein 2